MSEVSRKFHWKTNNQTFCDQACCQTLKATLSSSGNYHVTGRSNERVKRFRAYERSQIEEARVLVALSIKVKPLTEEEEENQPVNPRPREKTRVEKAFKYCIACENKAVAGKNLCKLHQGELDKQLAVLDSYTNQIMELAHYRKTHPSTRANPRDDEEDFWNQVSDAVRSIDNLYRKMVVNAEAAISFEAVETGAVAFLQKYLL